MHNNIIKYIYFRKDKLTKKMITTNIRNIFSKVTNFDTHLFKITIILYKNNKTFELCNESVVNPNNKDEIINFARKIFDNINQMKLIIRKGNYFKIDIIKYENNSLTSPIFFGKSVKRFYSTLDTKRFYSTNSNKVVNMDVKSILLKTDLSVKGLRDHLFKFIRTQNFNSNYVYLLIKASIADSYSIITLGYKTLVDITNKNDVKIYIDQVTKYFIDHKDQYYPKANDILMFYYIETDKISYDKNLRNKKLSDSRTFNIISDGIKNQYDIPFNTNYNSWGNLKRISITNSEITNIIFNDNIQLIEISKLNSRQTFCNVHFKDNNKNISFVDVDTKSDLDKIKRSYSNGYVLYFDQNKPFFTFDNESFAPKYELDKNGNETNRRSDVIQPIKKDKELNYNILTLDVETFIENNVFKILSLCFCDINSDGNIDLNSFYRGDYNSTDDLLKSTFDKLFTERYNKKYIYIHNGAKFDLIFIIKYLLSRDDIELTPIYKDGIFISIVVYYGKNINKNGKISYKYRVAFRDSMLLLPQSLANLGKSFNVETQKDIYPYDFPNISNLKYIGKVPDYKYFNIKKVSILDYYFYVKRFSNIHWNLREVTLDYCAKDCISLHQIIKSFAESIFNKFDVNIFHCPTLPSLGFRIYRANYLDENKLPFFDKKLYDELVKAYFGGHVDLYITKGPLGNNLTVQQIRDLNIPELIKDKGIDYIKDNFPTIKHYDVNALYPSNMLNNNFPTDIIGKFIGDIRYISDYSHYYQNNIGIYKVKVIAPDIKNPILPIKVNKQVLYPTGSWIGWYFSEELKNSLRYGYQFEILGGYVFDSADLFSSYINELNKIKETSEKGSAMYLIAKLLLNSLYGKLAISPHLNEYDFLSKDKFIEKMIDDNFKNSIKDWIDLDNHYLVGTENHDQYNYGNIAVGLAVTAYSRINMSIVKNNPDFNLFYSDTDSAFLDKYLPDDLVDNKKIGLFKLEAEYLLFISIGPKVYGAIDIYGNEYTKVKGFKNKIDLSILESLLDKNNINKTLTQEKWYKHINKSNITVNISSYDLKPNNNKRICIYENNIFTKTKNITVLNDKVVNK